MKFPTCNPGHGDLSPEQCTDVVLNLPQWRFPLRLTVLLLVLDQGDQVASSGR